MQDVEGTSDVESVHMAYFFFDLRDKEKQILELCSLLSLSSSATNLILPGPSSWPLLRMPSRLIAAQRQHTYSMSPEHTRSPAASPIVRHYTSS